MLKTTWQLICLVLFTIWCCKGAVPSDWQGSRLGTTKYNVEPEVIIAGQIDLLKARRNETRMNNRKNLLCSTFIQAALKPSVTLFVNIARTAYLCDWAIIIYAGDEEIERIICDNARQYGSIALCQRTEYSVATSTHHANGTVKSFEEAFTEQNKTSSRKLLTWVNRPGGGPGKVARLTYKEYKEMLKSNTLGRHRVVKMPSKHTPSRPIISFNGRATDAVAKTVLYGELLDILPDYKRVFLMDEDISLNGFNIKEALSIWDCSFSPAPLVVQPLISENTQYMKYLAKDSWRGMGVVASATGIVEQQVPMFDAIFFEWFIRRVIYRVRPHILQYGVDWGHDRSWCNAAKMYAKEVLGWADSDVPCALLVSAAPVHHLNTHSMANKKKDISSFRDRGFLAVQKYIDNFPTWVLLDVLRDPNPFEHTDKYRRIKIMNTTCLASNGYV